MSVNGLPADEFLDYICNRLKAQLLFKLHLCPKDCKAESLKKTWIGSMARFEIFNTIKPKATLN